MSNKLDTEASRRWIFPSVATATLVSLGTATIGWATNAYNWHMPLMAFSVGVSIVLWFGTIAIIATQCVKEFTLRALKAHRGKVVAETLQTLRRHEAEQWVRAARSVGEHIRATEN